jgi:hypothetical protein
MQVRKLQISRISAARLGNIAGSAARAARAARAPDRSDNLAAPLAAHRGDKPVRVQYGGHLHPYAHASLLAENVNSLSLCKLNLRPKNPEGCQPAYQTTRLPLYDTNGSCTPHLNFSFIT